MSFDLFKNVTYKLFTNYIYSKLAHWLVSSVCQWSRRPGVNPRSHHTKDFKNGT